MTLGMLSAYVCSRIRLPGLLGMICAGIVLGPYALNLIDDSLLNISAELRKAALIIILMRAGLTLDFGDLKRVGRPAMLMCFVPAVFEILGTVILAPYLFGISLLDAAIMGAVMGAVSPAVIVPKMIKLMEEGYGTDKGIPQLILAGASVDDVFVIVLFTSFTGLAQGNGLSIISFANIPVSIFLGIFVGAVSGLAVSKVFEKIHTRDTYKVIILLSLAFILVTAEDSLSLDITFSSLIAVMFTGIALQRYRMQEARRIAQKFNELWICAEIMLFVLVGATINLRYAADSAASAFLLICGALCFRMAGVFLCLAGTKLAFKERLFCAMAYIPKATVQAAIGGVPLAMELSCGNAVLTAAVVSIIITAPVGAFLIDATYKKLLNHTNPDRYLKL